MCNYFFNEGRTSHMFTILVCTIIILYSISSSWKHVKFLLRLFTDVESKAFKDIVGACGWLSWVGSEVLISTQVMISGSWDPAQCGAPCSAGSLLEVSLSSSTSAPLPTCSLFLSPPSNINK